MKQGLQGIAWALFFGFMFLSLTWEGNNKRTHKLEMAKLKQAECR